MKRILSSIVFILVFFTSFSNEILCNESYRIKDYSVCYMVNDSIMTMSIIEVQNLTPDYIWIFLNDNPDIDSKEFIYDRFIRKYDGDMSLFQWMIDGNVIWNNSCIDIFDRSFFKILSPNQNFYFVGQSDSALIKRVKQEIKILTSNEIYNIYKPLSRFDNLSRPSYQPNVVVF